MSFVHTAQYLAHQFSKGQGTVILANNKSQQYAADGRRTPFPWRLRHHSKVAAVLQRWAVEKIGESVARNIEIKAWSSDIESQERIAARLADGPPMLIEQEDTFFHAPRGRLKLREFGDGTGELIAYDRPDSSGPKQSTYIRSATNEPHSLKAALGAALGVRAVVKKRRTLFLAAQTRIHLDEVAGLGRFIELEVVLRPEQTEAEGRMIAARLMSELSIEPSDLIAGAYVDLLIDEEPNNSLNPTGFSALAAKPAG